MDDHEPAPETQPFHRRGGWLKKTSEPTGERPLGPPVEPAAAPEPSPSPEMPAEGN